MFHWSLQYSSVLQKHPTSFWILFSGHTKKVIIVVFRLFKRYSSIAMVRLYLLPFQSSSMEFMYFFCSQIHLRSPIGPGSRASGSVASQHSSAEQKVTLLQLYNGRKMERKCQVCNNNIYIKKYNILSYVV